MVKLTLHKGQAVQLRANEGPAAGFLYLPLGRSWRLCGWAAGRGRSTPVELFVESFSAEMMHAE